MLDDDITKASWSLAINASLAELQKRHPNLDIHMDFKLLPYDDLKQKGLDAIGNKTSIDIISLDQIWLGEFSGKGYLTDLTSRAKEWGRSSQWYQANWDGGWYNHKLYGIWAWTDIRGIWYWKDLLKQADVNPDSLKTWDGYITAAKKLNNALNGQGIQGVHLVGASHSPDMWYPYLWMLGGNILSFKNGHPTKGSYWYPAFNDTNGVKALEFLKAQVDAGIKPQVNHSWGNEFVNRSFAVMIEGSWMPEDFPPTQQKNFTNKVGFLPMFPTPDSINQSATLMGGYLLSIPETSKHKDLAWELETIMLRPDILTPMLLDVGYIPTQVPIGEGSYAAQMRQSIPYYDQMVSMLSIGHVRPNIPEYPQIADYLKQAIDDVYYGKKTPKEALDDAAQRSAIILGWK
jgi:multiple sugar transport system substrate-binding protein